jgi:uncharacterized protein
MDSKEDKCYHEYKTMDEIVQLFTKDMALFELFAILDYMFFTFDVNSRDAKGLSFLHHSVSNNQFDITKYLLDKGAFPNIQNYAGETPLLQSARKGHFQITGLLIDYGANPDIYDHNKDSPLLWATYNGHIEIVIFLIEAGADPYHCYKDGRDALRWGVYINNLYVVEYLSRFLRNIDYRDTYGQTIFEMETHQEIKNFLAKWIQKNKLLVLQYFIQNDKGRTEYQLIKQIGEFYN